MTQGLSSKTSLAERSCKETVHTKQLGARNLLRMKDALPVIRYLLALNMLATTFETPQPEKGTVRVAVERSVLQLHWVHAILSEMALAQDFFIITPQGKLHVMPAADYSAFGKHYATEIQALMGMLKQFPDDKEAITGVLAVALLSAWFQVSSGKRIIVTPAVPGESEYLRFLSASMVLQTLSAKALKAMPITKHALKAARLRARNELASLYRLILTIDSTKRKWNTAVGKFVNLLAYFSRATPPNYGGQSLNKFHLQAEYWLNELEIVQDPTAAKEFLIKIKIGDIREMRLAGIDARFQKDNAKDQAANRGRLVYHEILCETCRLYAIPVKELMETKSKAIWNAMNFSYIPPDEEVFAANYRAGNIAIASPIGIIKD